MGMKKNLINIMIAKIISYGRLLDGRPNPEIQN
jgi:hypothetical protein